MFKGTMLVVSVAFISCVASAQDPGPQQSERLNLLGSNSLPDGIALGPYTLGALLDNPRVVKELDLSDKQIAEVKATRKNQKEPGDRIIKESRERMAPAKEKKDDDEIGRLERERTQDLAELSKSVDEILTKKILDRRQVTRLRQIRLQAEGPRSFDREDVRIELDLLPEQITEIRKIAFQNTRSMRKAASLPQQVQYAKSDQPNSPEAKAYGKATSKAQSEMTQVRVTSMQAIEKVLSGPQRSRYRKMIGEPFDFLGLKDTPKETDKVNDPNSSDKEKSK